MFVGVSGEMLFSLSLDLLMSNEVDTHIYTQDDINPLPHIQTSVEE